MAVLTVAPGAYADMLDFGESSIFWGDQFFYDDGVDFIYNSDNFTEAYGYLYYDYWDYLEGGYIDYIIEYVDGYAAYDVYGLDLEIFEFIEYVDDYDPIGLMAYAFRNADTLYGGFYDDTLSGFGGNDVVYGNGGDDTIAGGDGRDILYGGSGYDSFLLTGKPKKSNVDKIMDYNDAYDNFWLDSYYYKLPLGELKEKYFYVGKKAHDKNDRIIYNSKTGDLIYDDNGKKKGHAKKIAELDKDLSIDHSDFFII